MEVLQNVHAIGFKNNDLRNTDNIELIRKAYEELLIAYQNSIQENIILDIELEALKGDMDIKST